MTLAFVALVALMTYATAPIAHADETLLSYKAGISQPLSSCGGTASVSEQDGVLVLAILGSRECSRLVVDGQEIQMYNESGRPQGPFDALIPLPTDGSEFTLSLQSRSGKHGDWIDVVRPAADPFCHVNLASALGSVVAGQTNIRIDFQDVQSGGNYYANPVNLAVSNPNLAPDTSVSIHWIDGEMINGQFQNAVTTDVIAADYDLSRYAFEGILDSMDSINGQHIMRVSQTNDGESAVTTTDSSQIAVEIGDNQWLNDAIEHANPHNFNLNLGQAFQAQGGANAPCYQGRLDE
jgi:hypothetical protein